MLVLIAIRVVASLSSRQVPTTVVAEFWKRVLEIGQECRLGPNLTRLAHSSLIQSTIFTPNNASKTNDLDEGIWSDVSERERRRAVAQNPGSGNKGAKTMVHPESPYIR